MASYVVVSLDTTAPNINIYAPRYTINDAINVITIESNENLAEYQDITLTDTLNNIRSLTFRRVSPNRYVGEISFIDLPIGIVSISARMMDEVGNLSHIETVTIEIKSKLSALAVKAKDTSYTKVETNSKVAHRVKVKAQDIL